MAQRENIQGRNTTTNGGVVITVYVESEDPIEKTKARPRFGRPRAAGTQGYDRRAQLLAYSRQLRNAGSEEKVQLPANQPRHRNKKRAGLTQPVRICSPSTQMPRRSNSRCRHECVAPQESREIHRAKKRKGSGQNCCKFLRKLKNMLKKLSCKETKW